MGIKKNFFYQVFYQLLNILLPLVLTPYVSRVLGSTNIGIYSYTFSIVQYFNLFVMLGINHHGTRTIASVQNNKEKTSRVFSELLFLHLFGGLFVFALFMLYSLFITREYNLLFVIQSFTVLAYLFDINWLFMGLERFGIVVARNSILKLISAILVFIFVKNSNDLWKYTLIISAGTFFSQSVAWLFYKKYVSIVKPAWKALRAHIKPVIILFFPVVGLSLYGTMSHIMLGQMANKSQLGFYDNVSKIMQVPFGFIGAFGQVMIPRMSHVRTHGSEQERERITMVSVKYIMLLAIGACFGFIAIAERFSPIFWGIEFKECGLLLAIISIGLPIIAFQNAIMAQYLIPYSKDKVYLLSTVVGGIINVVLNLLLIPHLYALGTVVAGIMAEATRCAAVLILVRTDFPLRKCVKGIPFFVAIGCAMLFLLKCTDALLQSSVFTLSIQVLVGALFYLLASAIYLHKSKDEYFIRTLGKVKLKITGGGNGDIPK